MKDALGAVQSVLVLGGSSDIGTAIASALAGPRQAKVILAGRSPAALEEAAGKVRESGAGQVTTMPFDAVDTASHTSFVQAAFAAAGEVDVVVLAFAVLGDQEAAEKDPATALEILRTNYLGAVSVALPVVARLREQGHGTLVVMSTVAAERPRRDNFIYGSSKAGLDTFAQGLGDALVGTGVGVLVVRPGFVRSKMTTGMPPAPFATSPEAVAADVMKGLSRGDDTVWSPPVLRWVMAALRHLPRPLFRRVAGAR